MREDLVKTCSFLEQPQWRCIQFLRRTSKQIAAWGTSQLSSFRWTGQGAKPPALQNSPTLEIMKWMLACLTQLSNAKRTKHRLRLKTPLPMTGSVPLHHYWMPTLQNYCDHHRLTLINASKVLFVSTKHSRAGCDRDFIIFYKNRLKGSFLLFQGVGSCGSWDQSGVAECWLMLSNLLQLYSSLSFPFAEYSDIISWNKSCSLAITAGQEPATYFGLSFWQEKERQTWVVSRGAHEQITELLKVFGEFCKDQFV